MHTRLPGARAKDAKQGCEFTRLCREEEKMSATFGDPLHETEAAKAEGASVVVATAVAVKAVVALAGWRRG